MLYSGCFTLFRVGGWLGGGVAGKAEIIPNTAHMRLGLGLSLAIKYGLKVASL